MDQKPKTHDLYDYWAPQLREYSRQCRRSHPHLNLETLSVVDLAKYEVYCHAISSAHHEGRIRPNENHHVMVVNSSSLVGLNAAEKILGASSDSVICLLDSENARWFNEIYKPSDDQISWYSFFSWAIEFSESVDGSLTRYIAENYPKPIGFSYWVVREERLIRCVSSAVNYTLWKWDGAKAEPLEHFCSELFHIS